MRREGFTLIELLVVISIIALLSSVVLVSLNSARDKARYAAVAQGLRQMDIAFNQLYHERGCWPREGSTDCNGIASSNPTLEVLMASAPFGLNKYISEALKWPFSTALWKYDNDGDSRLNPCTVWTNPGVGIFIENVATAEQYRALNKLFDGDSNPDTDFARGCGKILFTGTTGNGTLNYIISAEQ